jgi:uncharacterized protein (DUF488 family)
MKAEDVIRMAREAGLYTKCEVHSAVPFDQLLERFAVLVAAAEREAIKWNRIHSCHADCQNPACVIVREAIAAEREACAKVAEERLLDKANCTAEQMYEMMKKSIADAIRARGAP